MSDSLGTFVLPVGREQQEVQFSIGRKRTPKLAQSCKLSSGGGSGIFTQRVVRRQRQAPFASLNMSQGLPATGTGARQLRLPGAAHELTGGATWRLR